MIKKLFLSVPVLFFLFSSLPAQESGPKVLLVLGKLSDSSLVPGLQRAVQLKKAGVEVRIIFEREAVLSFIDQHDGLSKPGWRKKMESFALEVPTDTVKDDSSALHPKFKLPDMNLKISKDLKSWMQKIKDEQIPYTVCSASAKYIYDVYDELKATGEPLSSDPEAPVDISPYLKQGYQVLVY